MVTIADHAADETLPQELHVTMTHNYSSGNLKPSLLDRKQRRSTHGRKSRPKTKVLQDALQLRSPSENERIKQVTSMSPDNGHNIKDNKQRLCLAPGLLFLPPWRAAAPQQGEPAAGSMQRLFPLNSNHHHHHTSCSLPKNSKNGNPFLLPWLQWYLLAAYHTIMTNIESSQELFMWMAQGSKEERPLLPLL